MAEMIYTFKFLEEESENGTTWVMWVYLKNNVVDFKRL